MDRRLPKLLLHHMFLGIDGLVGGIPQGTADTDGIIVPKISAYLSDDHGNRIGGEFDIQIHIEIIYGFNKADTADLKQIVHIFIAGGKTLDNA